MRSEERFEYLSVKETAEQIVGETTTRATADDGEVGLSSQEPSCASNVRGVMRHNAKRGKREKGALHKKLLSG